ncbi:MAG: sel1 repeat family protein [Alphaproteobacteria bacterium]|nr:sel1 repeat family protein [Alphaproteobacteria bacterium]
MKNKVFCLLLILSCAARSDFLRSDLELLGNAPALESDSADPYWDLAWHGRVASYGDPDSQFFVANVYEQGKLVPQNIQKAVEFYQKAAKQGHLESCHKLAHLLPSESEKWYLVAAELNDPQAQLRLAHLYRENGDIPKAVFWMEKALHLLFPDVSDLTTVSPDLEELKSYL